MQYEKVQQIETGVAPVVEMKKEEMLIVLYEAAIRHTEDAMAQIDSKQIEREELFSLGKAFGIVDQFIVSLDYDKAPELCEGLANIYQSMLVQMHKAYDNLDSEPLKPVVDALKELKDTWVEALEISKGNKVSPEA